MGELRLRSAGGRLCAVAAVFAGLAATSVEARVTRIVIDATAAITNQPAYEQVTGRAFGEIDPANPHNALITDITNPLARDPSTGKVTYVASFVLRKPKDMATASGVMWHDVPNRGGDVGFPNDSFAAKA